MADEAVAKVGVMLEQLSARFELVVEAVTGYGGRFETLHEDILSQFTEVGRQIRFLSDQIAVNRSEIAGLKSDLGAEIVRLGETLGATRVEFRGQLAAQSEGVRREVEGAIARTRAELARAAATVDGVENASTRDLRDDLSAAADAVVRKLSAELKSTGKALATLGRKFDRFDDRMTVQTRDQDQRLKKLERKAR